MSSNSGGSWVRDLLIAGGIGYTVWYFRDEIGLTRALGPSRQQPEQPAPTTTTPAGAPEGPGFVDQFGNWVQSGVDWVTDQFDAEDETEPQEGPGPFTQAYEYVQGVTEEALENARGLASLHLALPAQPFGVTVNDKRVMLPWTAITPDLNPHSVFTPTIALQAYAYVRTYLYKMENAPDGLVHNPEAWRAPAFDGFEAFARPVLVFKTWLEPTMRVMAQVYQSGMAGILLGQFPTYEAWQAAVGQLYGRMQALVEDPDLYGVSLPAVINEVMLALYADPDGMQW